ncbi:hypothetical protein IIC65_00895, partial [Candidatus Sumerlaeota bacterium]|nr:hypothetical protein [Candidatus Sumerlaeota bacterium]
IGVIALGVAVRLFLFFTGRIPIDGDEGIMGVMGYHLSRLEHFPLYFYRQHYLGSLEVPPVALLQMLGPEAWKFSIWPIRLVQFVFFVVLALVHFKLAARFFGACAGRWILFFLCIGSFYWLDYSSRLRHMTVMMLLGESLALVALGLIRQWDSERTVRAGRVFLLGLLIGLAWWHFQLVSIFIGAMIVLFLLFPSFPLDCIRKTGPGDSGPLASRLLWPNIFRILIMAVSVTFLAGLSMGWIESAWIHAPFRLLASLGVSEAWIETRPSHYPWIVLAFLLPFCAGAWLTWRAYRTERAGAPLAQEPLQHMSPLLLIGGFLVGYAPALLYLVVLRDEFWVAPTDFQFRDFWTRMVTMMRLEVSSLLEIPPPVDLKSIAVFLISLTIYSTGLYVLLRKLFGPDHPRERVGAVYYLTLLLTIIMLNVLFRESHPTAVDSPRFMVPAFVVTSVGLGLVANQLVGPLRNRTDAAGRVGFPALCVLLVACSLFWWGSRALNVQPQEMSWPSGHRKVTLDVLAALNERGIQRVRLPTSTKYHLFAYELQHAGRLKIRFNRGLVSDRLEGFVDEDKYGGRLYMLNERGPPERAFLPGLDLQGATPDTNAVPPGGFRVRYFNVYPIEG